MFHTTQSCGFRFIFCGRCSLGKMSLFWSVYGVVITMVTWFLNCLEYFTNKPSLTSVLTFTWSTTHPIFLLHMIREMWAVSLSNLLNDHISIFTCPLDTSPAADLSDHLHTYIAYNESHTHTSFCFSFSLFITIWTQLCSKLRLLLHASGHFLIANGTTVLSVTWPEILPKQDNYNNHSATMYSRCVSVSLISSVSSDCHQNMLVFEQIHCF